MAEMPTAQPQTPSITPPKKGKNNFLTPLLIALFAVAAFLGVMYFALTK